MVILQIEQHRATVPAEGQAPIAGHSHAVAHRIPLEREEESAGQGKRCLPQTASNAMISVFAGPMREALYGAYSGESMHAINASIDG